MSTAQSPADAANSALDLATGITPVIISGLPHAVSNSIDPTFGGRLFQQAIPLLRIAVADSVKRLFNEPTFGDLRIGDATRLMCRGPDSLGARKGYSCGVSEARTYAFFSCR